MPTGNPFTTATAAQTMAPTDYTVEQNQVLRQQQLADLLRKQAMEQGGGTEMVSGWAVKKSPLEGASKIAQALGAHYVQNQTDEKQLALAKKIREQGVTDMQGVMGAMQGTPEKVTDFAPDTFDAQDAQNMQQAGAMQNVQPAIAPDRRQAMALALQSQSPMVQGIGAKLLESEMKAPEWTLGERFNKETGMAEKFMYNKNNPAQMQDIGGQQAEKIIADNTGGALVYRGEHSVTPRGTVAKTVTPDAVLTDDRTRSEGAANRGVTVRGQNMTDSRTRAEGAANRDLTARGQDLTDRRAGEKPITDSQSKALLFGTRMKESNKILAELADDGVTKSIPGSQAGFGIGGVVTALSGEKLQRLDQAKRDFLNATLRRESGAVIADSEFDNGNKQYFPQVGDSKAVIAQKARNREISMRGILAEVPEQHRGKIDEIAKTDAPASGQKSTSKSGKPIVFVNGRWEYE